MIGDLLEVWQNSEVNGTVAYDIVISDFGVNNNCELSAIALSNNSQMQSLRNQFNADIVVYMPPNAMFHDGTACVAAIGPIDVLSYSIVPLDASLIEYTFPHEIGHICGLNHEWKPHYEPICAKGYDKIFYNSEDFNTVLAGSSLRIPYYSDPNITWNDIPIGTVDEENHNRITTVNAGKIRNTICEVANFRNSSTITSNIHASEENCQLRLESVVSVANPLYTYQWSWSYDGSISGTPLGSGNTILVDEPVSDNCSFYFISLEVFDGNTLISNSMINLQSDICLDNVQPCAGSSRNIKPQPIDSHTFQPNYDKPINHTKSIYRLYNTSGQLINSYNHLPSNEEILFSTSKTGLFILQEINNNKIVDTRKIYNYED